MNSEKAIKIYDYIRKNKGLCKKDISVNTAIGYSIVDKHLNILRKNKLIRFVYTKNSLKDNRRKYYYLNLSKFSIVYNFTFDLFEMYIITPNHKIKKHLKYSYNNFDTFEKNIDNFIWGVNTILSEFNPDDCLGSATFVIPESEYENQYHIPFSFNVFKKLINRLPIPPNIVITNQVLFKTEYVISQLSKDDNVLILFMDKQSFISCSVTANSDSNDVKYMDFGAKNIINNVTLKEYTEFVYDPEGVLMNIVNLIKNTSLMLPINKVYICGNAFCTANTLAEVIDSKLNDDFVSIYPVTSEDICKYAADKVLNANIEHIFESNLPKKVDK